jgi:hypothetical protein
MLETEPEEKIEKNLEYREPDSPHKAAQLRAYEEDIIRMRVIYDQE